MAAKLFYKDKQLIGLDISQTSLKVMAVDAKKWLVQGYGSIDLDPKKMHDALNADNDEDTYISDNLTELMRDHVVGDLPSNHVVIGVPTGQTFSRTFSLPADQEKHLSDAVEIEVSQYIPIPMSALYVDYQVIDRNEKTIEVIMSAVPKKIIDNCLAATKKAGLRPVVIEPGINAIARVLEATEEAHLSTLIVDIGQATTDIAALDGGAIRVSGGVGVGGNTFTLSIAKKLKVPLDTAHQLKVLNGLAAGQRQAKLTRALEPNLQQITTEIRKVIRYYTERLEEAHKIEQVLIVGAGSNVPGIGDYFTNELVMPVRVASPWQKLDFAKLEQPHKQFRPRYIAVAGLASVPLKGVWQ